LLKKSIPAFDIVLKKSLTLQLAAFFIVFLVLLSCFLNNLPLVIQLSLLLIVIVIGLGYHFSHSNIINYLGITKISCRADGYFKLQGAGNYDALYKLQKTTSVLGSCFFLHFQPVSKAGLKPKNIILLRDSLTREAARQLRVTLHVYKTAVLV